MSTFVFVVSTPEGVLFEGDVRSVMLKNSCGDFAVYSGHIPMLSDVAEGVCTVVSDRGKREEFEIGGGVLMIEKEKMTLMGRN